MIPRWPVVLLFAMSGVACGDRGPRVAERRATDSEVAFAPSAARPTPEAAPPSEGFAAGGPIPDPAVAPAVDSAAGAMIIRSGRASVQVDSLDAGVRAVREVARRVGGWVANVSLQAGRDQTHTATIEIKVPAARFDEALAGLRPIGQVESVDVTAQDVGEEYVDVGARVANARRLEGRLVELLATRTGKLSDVLSVERELARVREEIERQEGRLRYLRTRAATSTLAVTVHEPLPVVGERGSGGVLAESFREAWRNFVGFVAGFIAALGTLVPAALLVTGAAVVAVRMRRRFRAQE
ncbi:MAG TPA: DUF4349 domain-containing protein [Gemmatimonadaceae bacterium]|nr:DUF4349 domain-containing protein [Gemmatimonadaceae bacterium]